MGYFVPVELEPELDAPPGVVADPDPDTEPLAEPEPDVVVSVDERGVVVVVGGDADGVRSPGRSVVRVVLVSVHAVASVAINASAENPASVRFMKRTLLWSVRTRGPNPDARGAELQCGCREGAIRGDLLPVKCSQVEEIRS